MVGVRFTHKIGTLQLRLPPTQVEWDYKMNVQTYQTYAGEVVQVLGINFNKVTFQGRFGREGAHGKRLVNGRLVNRPVSEYTDWNTNEPYGVGLSQMFQYFKTYFSAASQGSVTSPYHYDQAPMTISHEGHTGIDVDPINNKGQSTWLVYPTSFPSFKRSNEDFAPEWKIECEVYEAPFEITTEIKDEIFDSYRKEIGWQPMSEYSDPLGMFLPKDPSKRNKEAIKRALDEAENVTDQVIDYWRNLTPAVTPTALEELLMAGASLPNVYNLNKKNRGRKNRAEANRKLKFGQEGVSKGGDGGLAGVDQGNGSGHFPGQLPGETDEGYAQRMNQPPSGQGENYGSPAPIKFPGEWMGPGSDDRYDLSYTKNTGGGNWQDSSGQNFDEKGRIH